MNIARAPLFNLQAPHIPRQEIDPPFIGAILAATLETGRRICLK
jgi:hypothetical protein